MSEPFVVIMQCFVKFSEIASVSPDGSVLVETLEGVPSSAVKLTFNKIGTEGISVAEIIVEACRKPGIRHV